MNISPRDDGYSVCLLKGTVSEENYITILDNQGQMCFEPIACNVGIMDTHLVMIMMRCMKNI